MDLTFSPDDHSFRWERPLSAEHTLKLTALDVRKERTGYHAEINIVVNAMLLAYSTFNIGRQEDRTRLAKTAYAYSKNGSLPDYPFEALTHDLDVFCKLLKTAYEESPAFLGNPPVPLDLATAVKPPEYLLRPMVYRSQATLLYGHGGTAKSILGLTIACIVATPWVTNPLRLAPMAGGVPTGYFDWETSEDEVRWRLKALREGCSIPPGRDVLYRHCLKPLAEDLQAIESIVRANGLEFLIVDSLGGACGDDLKDNKVANMLFLALRKLGCASLLITHLTKADIHGTATTPFGSTYFWNWARMVWETKKNQDPGEDSVSLGLFHRKANNSRLQNPIGLRLDFLNKGDELQQLTVKRMDLTDDAELSKNLSATARIEAALRTGAMSQAELIEELNLPENTIKVSLYRLTKRGKVVRAGTAWGLPTENDDLPF